MRFTALTLLARLLSGAAGLTAASAIAVAGPKAYVGNFKDNTVSVIDTASDTVTATVPVASGPHGIGVSPDGRRVYVTSDGASTLSIIDTATDRVVHTIEVGKTPHGVALSPDGRLLLVAVYGEDRIDVIDTAAEAVTATVEVPKPHTISIHPDGKEAYVASQEPGRFALAVVDLAQRAVARTVPLDKPPRDLEFGHDGKALYFTQAGVNAIQVLDPASDRIVASVPTGASPHYVNWFRGTALAMAVVQGPGELFLFDPAGHKPSRSIAVGKQPHWLTVSGGGTTAYVTNEGSNNVTVVDLATGRTKTIPVGNAPRKVAVQPQTGGARVSITNFEFSPSVVTIAPGDNVTWSNDDGAPHAIAFKDGIDSPNPLLPQETFRRIFDRPGTYDYACTIHPYMAGRVVVRRT